MKKIFLLILVLAVFIVSCGDNAGDDNIKSGAGQTPENLQNGGETGANDNDGETVEITAQSVLADLPDANYGGYTFTVLTSNLNDGAEFEWRQAPEETETGEPINDALFRRDRLIEEKYNINIKYIIQDRVGEMASMAQRTIRSGDNLFDMVVGEMIGVTRTLAQSGAVHDFLDFPNVDLSKPWWNQNAIRDLMIDNKFFFPTGDVTPRYVLGPYFLMFNKDLFADHGLDLPYEKVLDGTWTFDEFQKLIKDKTRDTNGDGTYDFFGMFNAGFSAYAFMKSFGESIIGIQDGNPFISVGNERSMHIIQSITDLLTGHDMYFDLNYAVFDEYHTFTNSRALFVGQTAAILVMYRDMDDDFGIIPLPKFDLNQKSYYSYAQPWDSVGLSVPKTNENTERTGMIIEALAAVGRYTSTPAQYEVTLQTKFARDEYSAKMLDIICETATFDLGHIYNFGGVFDRLNNSMHRNLPFASELESIMGRMQAEIDRTIAIFAES